MKAKVQMPDGTWRETDDPLVVQVGGDHYTSLAIQPVEFTAKNNFSFLQGCIIKRISRYNLPGGKGLEDLEKIKHEVDLIVELEKWKGD